MSKLVELGQCRYCGMRFAQVIKPGRKRVFCDRTCRHRARQQPLRSPVRSRAPIALGAAQGLQDAVARLLDGEHAQAELGDLLGLAREVVGEVEQYVAAAVSDARARGAGWSEVARASHVSVATARSRWSESQVERLLRRRVDRGRAWRVGGGGPQVAGEERGAPLPPQVRAGASPARVRAGGKLALALSFLLRHSGQHIKQVAERTVLSPSYVSRIVSGERLPTWPAARALAEACGGDAADVRPLWEAAQGIAPPARLPLDEAVARLAAALRGLYLAAGCPPFSQLSRVSGHVVPPDVVEKALGGQMVPCWGITSALLSALNAQPGDVRGLWDDANYAFLLCLYRPVTDGPLPALDA